MLIALEGCDGVGKTTLARRLATLLTEHRGERTAVLHRGPPERHPLEEYELDLDGYAPGRGMSVGPDAWVPGLSPNRTCRVQVNHVVLDRWHWGETVYGELYRGESLLGGSDGPGRRHVDLYLRSRGALMVHVETDEPAGDLAERLRADGEDYLRLEHVGRVLDRYREMARMSVALPVDAANPLSEDPDLLDHRLLYEAEAREAEARPLIDWPRYVGPPSPSALLVGEETSPRHLRGERPTYAAPFVPYRDSCAWWLLEALPVPLLASVGLVNARETSSLEALWAALEEPRVVALGKTASEALDAAGIAHGRVKHPQWVRRFKHGRLAEYGGLIARAARTQEDLSDALG